MRVTLPSKQADGSPNFVDLKSPDDFMASDLFAIHRAVRVKSSANGETEYSAQEWADDRVNAFLSSAITGWSFPSPIPAQASGVAAADVVIGRTMRAKDWAALRRAAQPLMDELEGEGLPDPKSGGGAADAEVPVPAEPAG
jgi:hypothetical protein